MAILDHIKGHRQLVVFTHDLADLDAAASAASIAMLASREGIAAAIVTPGGATRAAKALLRELSLDHLEDAASAPAADFVVLVDAGSPSRAKGLEDYLARNPAPLLIIDHHPAPGVKGAIALIDASASSTSEIIARDLARDGALDPEISCALGVGIAADTRGLSTASCEVLGLYSDLCSRCGWERLRSIMAALRGPRDRSEVLARLRALRRTRIIEVGGWLLVISSSGSHQSSVAQALLQVGADVGIALGAANGWTEGSAKAQESFVRRTGLHLGELAKALAKELGGTGGGHRAAAAFRVRAAPGATSDALLRLIGEALNSEPKDVV